MEMDDDPFVPVWEGPFLEAEHLRLRLEEAHIPVEFGDALLTGHARVQVPRSYLDEVKDVVSGVQAPWPEITSTTGDGFDWKPGMRLALIGTAVVGVVLIVILALRFAL